MKVNWKEVCKSEGYKSLKKAMTTDIIKKHRSKKDSLRQFKWVIGRAQHYAYHLDKSIAEVLSEWESKRDYRWLNFYGESKQPLLNKSDTVKPRGLRTYLKNDHWLRRDPVKKKQRMLGEIMRLQKQSSKRKDNKARWTTERKLKQKRLKASVS